MFFVVFRWFRKRRWSRRDLVKTYGQWALVTGASAGVGREVAETLAQRGMSVVMVARRKERLESHADFLEKRYQVKTRVLAIDLSAPGSAKKLVDSVADLEIAMLVNNAGVGYIGRYYEQDPARQNALVQLNCTSPMELTTMLLPAMKRRRRGAVVFISSVAALQPLPLHAVYGASKAFLSSLGMALWEELKGTGVDVIVSEPGSIRTEFNAASGTHGQRGTSPRIVAEGTIAAVGLCPVVAPGSFFAWWRSAIASMLPRTWITPLARMRQQNLLPSAGAVTEPSPV